MRMSRRAAIYSQGGAGTGVPAFTYTGSYTIVESVEETGLWFVRFLTSGTLVFTSKGNLAAGVDIWACGGGGGGGQNSGYLYRQGAGGGGGYTAQIMTKALRANTQYDVVIGAGGLGDAQGVTGTDGYASSFGSILTAAGGKRGAASTSASGGKGGDGGSGGGGGANGSNNGGEGGTNGGNGGAGAGGAGVGAGISTYEFGDTSLILRCGGGAGATYGTSVTRKPGGAGGGGAGGTSNTNTGNGEPGTTNYGGGGGGAASLPTAGNGGSGIVCIRSTR